MKFYMKQKVFSWGDKFTIKNENGEDAYTVKGEVFTLGKKLHVNDTAGAEVAFIRQRLLSWLLTYDVFVGETQVMEVRKDFTLFKPRYSVTGAGDWRIQGDYWAHNYEIFHAGGSVAHISKQWFTWGDSYLIDIAPGAPEVPVLACVLAIDAALAVAAAQRNN
jgi:uncharacterized protein YxjI